MKELEGSWLAVSISSCTHAIRTKYYLVFNWHGFYVCEICLLVSFLLKLGRREQEELKSAVYK